MPGICRFSPERLPPEVEDIARLKIPAVILFGIPQQKTKSPPWHIILKGSFSRRYGRSSSRSPSCWW